MWYQNRYRTFLDKPPSNMLLQRDASISRRYVRYPLVEYSVIAVKIHSW